MSVHLKREIERLKVKILAVGASVEASLEMAIQALRDRDISLADKVIAEDFNIDQIEVETEEDCLKMLALYHPVAADLRFVIAVLKINNDLERIADQAVNIAERTKVLCSHPPITIPPKLYVMFEKVEKMLSSSLDALVNLDVKVAYSVIRADDDIDEINREMFTLIKEKIQTNPEKIEEFISLLSISRQLERTADQITNIAEDVIYTVEGSIIRHQLG